MPSSPPANAPLPDAPFCHGVFSVSSATIPVAGTSTDLVEVVPDPGGRLSVALLDVQAAPDLPVDGLRRLLCTSLERGTTLHALADRLAGRLEDELGRNVQLALGIVRLSPYDGCVEVLNVGIPPISCILPSGRSMSFEAHSDPIVARARTVHPYAAVSLPWNGLWLLASDGLTLGRNDRDAVHRLIDRLEARERGPALASAARTELNHLMRSVLSGEEPSQDATLIAIGARTPAVSELHNR